MLPQDPIILLSYVNTQLRDNYSSLDKLAEGLDMSEEEVKEMVGKLEGVGYKYDEEVNQFK
ncbi:MULTISPECIES: DUF4250 domain-containing protein [unclassified Butyrivibrio]|jgi:biotin operon repressor|uniref:DUF4250 domain-containing protein n=1 Tax=unclassified Butyrivibrio TaxID=2639466 RepID=UPI0003B77414|nr:MULTISPECIES: DUF4250 domain-containing protein [unclassified Butyrivibrio]